MDNENGTTALVATKVDEPKPIEANVIDTPSTTDAAKPVDSMNLDNKLVSELTPADELKKLNSLVHESATTTADNTTSTTVTVHVTKTVVTHDEAKKDNEVEQIVSSAASAAVAAVSAATEKLEGATASKTDSPDDIEMIEENDDIEMADVSGEKQIAKVLVVASTTDNGDTKAPEQPDAEAIINSTVEANEVATVNSEAQRKIDENDVEKNISNLFNGGDENNVSTEDLHSKLPAETVPTNSSSVPAASTSDGEVLKNGSNESGNKSPLDDTIKDNNELVSILAGHDKSDDKISSTEKTVATKPAASKDDAKAAPKLSIGNSIDKALLAGKTSTPSSSAVAQSTVYNSTPIEKQFEISSENESTISDAVDSEHIIGNKSIRQEIISSHSSTANEKSSDLSSAAVTGSESEQTSPDNLARYAKAVRQFNGLADETDASSGQDSSIDKTVSTKKASATKGASPSEVDSSIKATPKGAAANVVSTTSENIVYDINICYDNAELAYFSVERQDANKTGSSADKQTSIGSVNSIEQFSLPTAVTSTNSTLSSTSSGDSIVPASSLDRTKHEVKGTRALCTFIIEHFQKIRTNLTGVAEPAASSEATPVTSGRRGRNANAAASSTTPSTPSSTTTGSKRKRTAAQSPAPAVAGEPTDVDDQPKSAKKTKKAEPAPVASNYPEKAVLARWVDKKFYAGRVIDQKPNNKYVVLFEDGAKKVLPEEHIVFGEENTLPLINECVHALVKDDTYEPGIVQSVENKTDAVYYTVLCDSTTVTVTASDIYLEDDQAKIILSKREVDAANNPEPGFSGGINTRKDRRQKRKESSRQMQWFSESDVSDIVESDSRPASPVTVPIEAVDGVQPELQHTQKESELVRICYLMERFGDNFKKVNLDNVLGPVITSNILKNKSFLLTCTIPIKSVNGTTNERQTVKTNGHDLSNKNMSFSTVPYFKDYLKQQIESAGGIVYNNFENVPTNKYRTCFLLAPFPCITAKYVQCLASNITAVSHEWIVECCHQKKLVNKDDYVLPSGWSLVENTYKPWSLGRYQRKNTFSKSTVILTSQQPEFVQFWSRVCKAAGAKIRIVKSVNDLTNTTKGYILLDDEFPQEYQNRADRYRIPIVSTVWVIQSLILGKVCDPNAHPKLTQLYEDDYF